MRYQQIKYLLLLGLLPLLFQNCRPVAETNQQRPVLSTSLSSGGEVYDGKLEPGTYVQEVIQLGCNNNSIYERSNIVVDRNLDIKVQSLSPLDCAKDINSAEVSSIAQYADNKDYLAYKGGIYKRLEKLEKGWVTEIWCRPESAQTGF